MKKPMREESKILRQKRKTGSLEQKLLSDDATRELCTRRSKHRDREQCTRFIRAEEGEKKGKERRRKRKKGKKGERKKIVTRIDCVYHSRVPR